MKYVRKPLTVEAVHWTGENEEEILTFTGDDGHFEMTPTMPYLVRVNTLVINIDGYEHYVDPTDYVIRRDGRLERMSEEDFVRDFYVGEGD